MGWVTHWPSKSDPGMCATYSPTHVQIHAFKLIYYVLVTLKGQGQLGLEITVLLKVQPCWFHFPSQKPTMASHCFQNSVQIPLPRSTDSDTNNPFQTLPNALPKIKTQCSAPKHHVVSSLLLASLFLSTIPILHTSTQLHATCCAFSGAVDDAPI